ncbi:hypothetical protein HQ545_08925 [Candidatus Woesearchaeota archaeon]|nr:hypothetical protein [Candidatus Woesearchaeota archaeon]
MDYDISKRTVMVLLVLTLVVSIIGTWTILSQPTTIYRTIEMGGPSAGEVSVSISPAEGVEDLASESEGIVSIDIQKEV